MKNIIAITFMAVYCVFTFTGCAKNKDGITVIGTWGGSELETFQKMTDAAGINVNFETTRDLDAVLAARSRAGNLPDIGILPNPSKLKELAGKGILKPLDYLNSANLDESYSPIWLKLGGYGGSLYGIFIKAANKSVIWYNPEQFSKNGWTVPRSWKELLALTEKIRKSGKTPWAVGADIGWPLTDWIENIMARTAGPELYEKWVRHEISWDHPAVRRTFETWGQIVGNSGNLSGGIDGTLADSFQNSAISVFRNDPKAYLYFEGDFIGGIVQSQLTNIVFGKTMDFFEFPPIENRYGKPVIGGADVVVAFHDNPEVRKFMEWLVTEKANRIAAQNGFISPHRQVPASAYAGLAERKSAALLRETKLFLFDASDLMPPAVGNQGGFWDACKRYIENTNQIGAVLDDMEELAKNNY